MKIKTIKIHNFRSIKDITINPFDYSVMLGSNNAGKSNVLTALRVFYENGIKFSENTDFPKLNTDDDESWIDIEYELTNNEYTNLDAKYQNPGNILKIRKYLQHEDKVASNQSNLYGYEKGKLSDNLFIDWKTKGQSKLGNIIYIPEITKADETMKLTAPSTLREIVTFVMKKVVKNSDSYSNLNTAFESFNEKFKEEASKDGFSLNKFKEEINESVKEWEIEFDLDINPIRPEDIIKNLVSHHTIDKNLDAGIDIKNLGQGLQRHLIYTMLRLSSQYTEKKEYKKKEFAPELTLILFEEPEAFLHPTQQDFLNFSLKTLSLENNQQIIVSTHSPFFVSKNIEDISSLIKLRKKGGITQSFQVSEVTKKHILEENNELVQCLKNKLEDTSCPPETKSIIRKRLGDTNDITRMEEESIRYLLWLNSERCCAFFADIVLICEGASEQVFIDYLIKNKWPECREKRSYILDSMGKYNIHRYMNLFKELGVSHSVLADRDEDANVHECINSFINDRKNEYTKSIDFFDKDIETFLGIPHPPRNRNDKKPLNIMWQYLKENIPQNKIDELKVKVQGLL